MITKYDVFEGSRLIGYTIISAPINESKLKQVVVDVQEGIALPLVVGRLESWKCSDGIISLSTQYEDCSYFYRLVPTEYLESIEYEVYKDCAYIGTVELQKNFTVEDLYKARMTNQEWLIIGEVVRINVDDKDRVRVVYCSHIYENETMITLDLVAAKKGEPHEKQQHQGNSQSESETF